MTIEYIDKPEQLPQLYNKISQAPWIALDTEFLREKTYYPVFCLLQIATPEWVVCVDPTTNLDLTELFEIINHPDKIKVLHACRQDLEIFYQLTGKVISPIFDTQIAAPLLGFQENPGYAMLVSSFLNVNLPKAHTRTDWSIRPLSQDQIQYAADDVIYLCQVYQLMLQKLDLLNRFDWLTKDFEALNNSELYQISPSNAWLKIKAKNKLSGKQLSIIQSLSQWREKTAQSENRPKNWLIRDDLLVELAKLQPKTVIELSRVRGINERSVKRYGQVICQLISEAIDKPPTPLNSKNKSPKKTQQDEAVVDVLTALVRIRADENSINPSILANRKDLEKLLCDDVDNPILSGWRYSMVGKELQALLQGQIFLSLKENNVIITTQ